MTETVYLNGALVPRSEARLSIDDHGFLYGYGLFETMRAYNGVIFLLDCHLRRLAEGAGAIGLADRLAGIDLAQACRDTLAANGLKEARLRLTVSGGAGTALPWVEVGGEPTVLVTARPYQPPPPKKYEEGFCVLLSSQRRCRTSLAQVKSVSYLASVLARREAADAGCDEALLLDEAGFIAEGAVSNVFFVRAGRLLTPSLESGVLPGVTRQAVMELAVAGGIEVAGGETAPADLEHCAEAFLTNSLMEVMPLVAVREGDSEIIIGDGQPGPVTRRLMDDYRRMAARATG